MIKQAIIPLAGLGTRLLPLTSVFAKELLPINGKPGIEYILDECVKAGIKDNWNAANCAEFANKRMESGVCVA